MKQVRRFVFTGLVALAMAVTSRAVAAEPAAAATPEQIEFFEKNIRPVLVENCYKCHSAEALANKKLKAKLYTDNLQGLLAGGDTGSPSIVPGEPDKSTLIKSIRHQGDDDSLFMPPKGKDNPTGKLPDAVIRNFEQWVKTGAKVPADFLKPRGETTQAAAPKIDPKTHWAFIPPVAPAIPAVKNAGWAKNDIDRLVLAKLEAKGITPSAPAEKATLIRRATFDLIGLPPTPEEVAAFLADESPAAYEKLIDRLLASPQYGEKWARHWLDVSRYADTKGYVFQEERRYPYAYTYRDYVIRSLNEDKPFDRFVLEQLAADQLLAEQPAGDKSTLAAMGFLTLGRRFLNNTHDIIDDRIDVVSRGLLGLTVACARCHDHKFDPVPTRDYYSLHGIFNSSIEPKDLPLIGEEKGSAAYEAELAKRKAAVDDFVQKKTEEILGQIRTPKGIADYLMATASATEAGGEAAADLNRTMVARFKQFTSASAQKKEPVLAAWRMFAAVKPEEFADKSKIVVDRIAKADGSNGGTTVNPLVRTVFAHDVPKSLRDVADRYGQLLAKFDKAEKLPNPDEESLRLVLRGPESPLAVSAEEMPRLFKRDARDKYNQLRSQVTALQATSPDAPPRAMVLNDSPTPGDSNVFVRGNPGNQGIRAPRQFLSILSSEAKPYSKGSGRLDMARAIASKENPLTARVLVNRVWGWHFGKPLVSTPSDFGVRTERPVQAELLDFLATAFVADGWSIKKLHRRIMLSAVYQQSSNDNPAARAIDPENNLLWRQNRHRLEFEGVRDSILAVAGQLNTSVLGRPVDIGRAEETRRTIYGFVDRQNLPSMFRSFDFASPDTHAPGRFSTTVPQQALFFLNSPFVHLQVKKLLERQDVKSQADQVAKVNRIHQLLYGRNASGDEIDLARLFLESEQAAPAGEETIAAGPAWSFGYGNIDEKTQRVTKLSPLPYKSRNSLRAAQTLPDPKLGFLTITATGGHPDKANAVIRRLTVPAGGTLTIEGALVHPVANGDGVRGVIVSSRGGVIGNWKVHNGKADTKVEKLEVAAGETIDFVTESGATNTSDSFTWTAKAVLTTKSGQAIRFDTQADFADALSPAPAVPVVKLGPWEKYVQVLLASNEFVFVE